VTLSKVGSDIGRTLISLARLAVGVVVLGVLVVRMGPEPFRAAVDSVGVGPLMLATGITALTTVSATWRWRIVAERLGVGISLPAGVAAYYRSQFLNATLPGGMIGDVHRGVSHGTDAGSVRRGLRAVAWERALGQAVQAALTVLVLLVLPLAMSATRPLVVATAGTAGAAVALLLWARRLRARDALPRPVATLADDLGAVLCSPRRAAGIVVASAAIVAGHVAIFAIAARASGVSASTEHLLPAALVVLVASAIPTNFAGWGPREGVAAWAFGAAGLGAASGLTTAVVYGLLSLAATLPGAVVLVAARPHPLAPPVRKAFSSVRARVVAHV
jgi:glycosyltransferase 2 family protein